MNKRADFSEALPIRLQGILSAEDIKALRSIAVQDAGIVADIVRAVSFETGIKAQAIYSPARHQKVVRARQIVMYIAHRKGLGFSCIARALNRDHSTVIYGVRAEAKRRGEA